MTTSSNGPCRLAVLLLAGILVCAGTSPGSDAQPGAAASAQPAAASSAPADTAGSPGALFSGFS